MIWKFFKESDVRGLLCTFRLNLIFYGFLPHGDAGIYKANGILCEMGYRCFLGEAVYGHTDIIAKEVSIRIGIF